MYRLACVVLAAGKASRFGEPKQLANTSENTLLGNALQQLNCAIIYAANAANAANADKQKKESFSSSIYVALGAHRQVIQPYLENTSFNVKPLIVEHWQLGMGHSLSESMKAIANAAYSHVLVTLSDLVAVTAKDHSRLINQSVLNPDNVIVSRFAKSEKTVLGAPAIFPRSYFSELSQLKGDVGARKVIQSAKTDVITVDNANAAIDIDTQQDLLDWQKTNLETRSS